MENNLELSIIYITNFMTSSPVFKLYFRNQFKISNFSMNILRFIDSEGLGVYIKSNNKVVFQEINCWEIEGRKNIYFLFFIESGNFITIKSIRIEGTVIFDQGAKNSFLFKIEGDKNLLELSALNARAYNPETSKLSQITFFEVEGEANTILLSNATFNLKSFYNILNIKRKNEIILHYLIFMKNKLLDSLIKI